MSVVFACMIFFNLIMLRGLKSVVVVVDIVVVIVPSRINLFFFFYYSSSVGGAGLSASSSILCLKDRICRPLWVVGVMWLTLC